MRSTEELAREILVGFELDAFNGRGAFALFPSYRYLLFPNRL